MDNIQNFIFDNFGLFFIASLVWIIGVFAWLSWRRKQRNLFPQKPKNIKYEEKFASGRSHKNWYTKIGGARNCLRLIITDKELWITPIFPLSALAGVFDLDHRIPFERIINIDSKKVLYKKSLLIGYKDNQDKRREVEVMSRNADRFETVLKGMKK